MRPGQPLPEREFSALRNDVELLLRKSADNTGRRGDERLTAKVRAVVHRKGELVPLVSQSASNWDTPESALSSYISGLRALDVEWMIRSLLPAERTAARPKIESIVRRARAGGIEWQYARPIQRWAEIERGPDERVFLISAEGKSFQGDYVIFHRTPSGWFRSWKPVLDENLPIAIAGLRPRVYPSTPPGTASGNKSR